jgi:hypothetical protein
MSTVPHSQPEADQSPAKRSQLQGRAPSPSDNTSGKLFDSFPYGADLTIRSNDSHEFSVPRLYVIHSSPVLAKLIQSHSVFSDDDDSTASASDDEEEPESESSHHGPSEIDIPYDRTIVSSLLTFVFPVPATLPSTPEQVMELLSAAQKYEMHVVLARIRDRLSRQVPPFIRPESAFHIYSLAQNYGLRDEARQAARASLNISITFEDLDDELDIMPGAYLHELWKYHQRVRGNLLLDLLEFRTNGARETLKDQHCVRPSNLGIPSWLDEYIESIAKGPASFDITKFHLCLMRHTSPATPGASSCPPCASISSETMHNFWEALTDVVNNSFGRVSPSE